VSQAGDGRGGLPTRQSNIVAAHYSDVQTDPLSLRKFQGKNRSAAIQRDELSNE